MAGAEAELSVPDPDVLPLSLEAVESDKEELESSVLPVVLSSAVDPVERTVLEPEALDPEVEPEGADEE